MDHQLTRYMSATHLPRAVILLYDVLLTFDDEVKHFWKARPSLGSFLFFFIRYIPLLSAIPLYMRFFPSTLQLVSL